MSRSFRENISLKFHNIAYNISRFTFEVLMRTFFKIRVYGKENVPAPPFIVTSNHASLLDPPLVGVACKKYSINFMAKKELFDAPLIGLWTRSVGCIEVDRASNSIKSLKESIKKLKEGRIVGIFPEGTRSEDGSLQEAKRGIGFLIAKAGVPVLPVYIEGSGKAFPKGGKTQFGSEIRMYIGSPIQMSEFPGSKEKGKQEYETYSTYVMERIAEIKNDFND